MKKLTFLLITKRVESLLQAIQYGQKKYRAFITLAMNTRYGRSDRVRTCGIDVPNVARYQLRHTPNLYILFMTDSQLSAALPAATKALSAFAFAHLPIAKLLPRP